MIERTKGKEEKDGNSAWEGLIERDGGEVGVGVGLPSNLSGCGSPLWTFSHRHCS